MGSSMRAIVKMYIYVYSELLYYEFLAGSVGYYKYQVEIQYYIKVLQVPSYINLGTGKGLRHRKGPEVLKLEHYHIVY